MTEARTIAERARALLASGRAQEAEILLRPVTLQIRLPDETYDAVLRILADALEMSGRHLAAASVHLFLGEPHEIERLALGHPRQLARAARAAGRFEDAVRHYEIAGWPVHAAILLETAEDFPRARELWLRVSEDPRIAENPYLDGLVQMNLGRVAARMGDAEIAKRHRARCVDLLLQVARHEEASTVGDLAYSSFATVRALGEETGDFDLVTTGTRGCIRLLHRDGLSGCAVALQGLLAEELRRRGWLREAAEIRHEAAEAIAGIGWAWAPSLRRIEADAWKDAAAQALREGSAADAGRLYLAAVTAYESSGAHGLAHQTFRVLAGLPGMDGARSAEYRAAARRMAAKGDVEVPAPDSSYVHAPDPAPTWHADLAMFEAAGDPVDACEEYLLDEERPWPKACRYVLLALLAVHCAPLPDDAQALMACARWLGESRRYPLLGPLETLFERGPAPVRVAVAHAASGMFYARALRLLRQAMQDPVEEVRRAAVDSLEEMRFPTAFRELRRVREETLDPELRAAALRAIARILTAEAVDYVIERVAHDDAGDEGADAGLLLVAARSPLVDIRLRAAEHRGEGAERVRRLLEARAARHA